MDGWVLDREGASDWLVDTIMRSGHVECAPPNLKLRTSDPPELVSRAEVKWVEQWLINRQGGSGIDRNLRLNKDENTSTSWTTSYNNKNLGGGGHTSLSTEHLLSSLQALAQGDEPPFDYNSDTDPASIVGRKVSIKWLPSESYDGQISHYSPTSGKHHVKYNDGDERDYILADKQCTFL